MPPRFRISAHQRKILELAAAKRWLSRDHVYHAVFGIPFRVAGETRRLPDSVKSSVFRSIRRLVDRGLLRKDGWSLHLTKAGARFLAALKSYPEV